jgi:hypothetical protein
MVVTGAQDRQSDIVFVMFATKFRLSFVALASVSAVYLAYLLSSAMTYPEPGTQG